MLAEKDDNKYILCHVGANVGEEVDGYALSRSIKEVVLVEANSLVIPLIKRKIESITEKYKKGVDLSKFHVINELVSDKKEEFLFNIYDKSVEGSKFPEYGLSSIYKLNNRRLSKDTVLVKKEKMISCTLDEALESSGIEPSTLDLLVLDVQGNELNVLKGFHHIENLKIITTEYSHKISERDDLYPDGCGLEELIDFLNKKGFYEMPNIRRYKKKHGNTIFINSRNKV